MSTQKVAIERNIETITKELVKKVWDKEFKLLKPMISSIASNNRAKMFKYEDIRVLESNSIIKKAKAVEKNSLGEKEGTIKENILKCKKKKIKISELEENDIRRIIVEGIKQGKNNYEALIDAGVIVVI
ncbi:hypothetical protein [Clostridium thailandense]|uniref:hypothetical protein n=1 Tax=Clostridium thailandense TaxID=2794346 RepID=UPI003989E91D